MREMMSDLNEMLEEKINGGDPDFDGFMQRWGDMFGDDPPKDFDDLLDRLRRQMAQTQSLLDSLSADQSQQLQDLMQSAFGDSPEMAAEMRRLAANMDYMDPLASMSRQYSFTGDEEIDLSGALDLMGQLQNMDDLERQIRRTRQGAPDEIDRTLLEETLGPEARQALDQLTELADRLEREGLYPQGRRQLRAQPEGHAEAGAAGAARDLRLHQERTRRRASGRAPRPRRRAHRRDQALRVRRRLHPASPADDHERGHAGLLGHTRPHPPRGFRGLSHRAAFTGGDGAHGRPQPLHGDARQLHGRQEGRTRARQPHPQQVHPRQALHRRLLHLRPGNQGRPPPLSVVGRVRPLHQHPARGSRCRKSSCPRSRAGPSRSS